MIHNFKLISTFDLDYVEERISISGGQKLLNRMDDCKEYHSSEIVKVEMSLKEFINFAKICIMSESGEGDTSYMIKYGIKFYRLSFDYRVFRYKNLAMQRGEIYFMYEVVTRHLCPDEFTITTMWPNEMGPIECKKVIFLCKAGYIFLTDIHMLDIVFFRIDNALKLSFNMWEPKAGTIGFDQEVKLGSIQTLIVPKSNFFPWLQIRYRDMLFGMPVRDWDRLKNLMTNYLLGAFDD